MNVVEIFEKIWKILDCEENIEEIFDKFCTKFREYFEKNFGKILRTFVEILEKNLALMRGNFENYGGKPT